MDNKEIENKLKLYKTDNCDLDLNKMKLELNQIFSSTNPLSLYMNFNNIKENFSSFMSCLSNTIVSWFNMWDWSKNLIMYIYKNSNYDKIWISITKNYLEQSKNFDINLFRLYEEKYLNNKNISFESSSEIALAIINNYSFNWKRRNIYEFVNLEIFEWEKLKINDILSKYLIYRWDFINMIDEILINLNEDDKNIFKKYINIEIIDRYFPEVRLIFYTHSSNNFLNKNEFTKINWKLSIKDTESEFSKHLNSQVIELFELKELILSLNKNVFSNFLMPVVYNLVSERLTVSKIDLDKMKYLLLNIFASNYSEYKKIFMFFNQLEIFLNYKKEYSYFDKIKVSFSLVILSFIILIISYFYLPIWIFLWWILLLWIKTYELLSPESYFRWQLNVWLKFFSILFISVSWYFWLQNMDNIKSDAQVLTDKIEVLWKLETKAVFEEWFKLIKTSLLEYRK